VSQTVANMTAFVHLQVILVTSIGTDEVFFPLNLLWYASHAPATIPNRGAVAWPVFIALRSLHVRCSDGCQW